MSYLYGLIYVIYIGCKIDHIEILRVFVMKALQQWCLCIPLELQVQVPILTRPCYLCVLKESKLYGKAKSTLSSASHKKINRSNPQTHTYSRYFLS